jgi:RNA polymerase sigma factor (sigma-70 family)
VGTRLTDAERAEVLAKHESMVWWLARKCAGPNANEDTIEEVASAVRAQFVRAAATYDPSQGFKFSTYAVNVARHYGLRAARAHRLAGLHVPDHHRHRKGPGGEPVEVAPPLSLDTTNTGLDGDATSWANMIPAREEEERREIPPDFWDRVRKVLPPRHAEVVELYYREGLTYEQVGSRIAGKSGQGVSRERVRQLLGWALESLRRNTSANLRGLLAAG